MSFALGNTTGRSHCNWDKLTLDEYKTHKTLIHCSSFQQLLVYFALLKAINAEKQLSFFNSPGFSQVSAVHSASPLIHWNQRQWCSSVFHRWSFFAVHFCVLHCTFLDMDGMPKKKNETSEILPLCSSILASFPTKGFNYNFTQLFCEMIWLFVFVGGFAEGWALPWLTSRSAFWAVFGLVVIAFRNIVFTECFFLQLTVLRNKNSFGWFDLFVHELLTRLNNQQNVDYFSVRVFWRRFPFPLCLDVCNPEFMQNSIM